MDDFSFYFTTGWSHIINIEAIDHLLFILALIAIYLKKDWKKILILVTAFTIGHSLTLALSVLNLITFNSRWVEFLIPCTILITAAGNFFQPVVSNKSVQFNYYAALFFGLIHGMGFANSIRFMLAKDQHIALPLFSFNLGLEFGQIAVVTGILLMSYWVVNILKAPRLYWTWTLSAISFCIALKLAISRWPWA